MKPKDSNTKPVVGKVVRRRRNKNRSKDKVLEYLRSWFEVKPWKEGERLPSIREIAQVTEASSSTVYLVFRQLAKEGKIRTELGNGSFLVGNPGQNRSFRIALNMPRLASLPHENHWTNGIATGILAAASNHHPRMMIMPCSTDKFDSESINHEILNEKDEVDGLILFPLVGSESLRASYEAAGKYVVNLNSPGESVTSNFVSPDYVKASYKIGQAFANAGRKRILYMAHAPFEKSVSARQRFEGLVAGIGEKLGISIHCQVVTARDASEAGGAEAIKKILDSQEPPPDAIYCVADLQAIGVLRVLKNAGIKVPETVSIISGTGMETNRYAMLTRTWQPLTEIGQTLVRMIADRMRIRGSVQAIYLPMKIIGGGTTTEEENQLLQISPNPVQDEWHDPTVSHPSSEWAYV